MESGEKMSELFEREFLARMSHLPSVATSPNLLLRARMPALERESLDFLPVLRTDAGQLCRVSTQLQPRIGTKPAPALDLQSLVTNFVRHAG